MGHSIEGLRWAAYGNDGIRGGNSMALVDGTGRQLRGVVNTDLGYIALSFESGGVIGTAPDFESAIALAESEIV